MNALATTPDYPRITDIRARPSELVKTIRAIREEATHEGINLSEKLERLDPTINYGADMRLDAFERLLMVKNIRVASIPHRGLMADRFERFKDDEESVELCSEWVSRVWRSVLHRPPAHMRVTFGSDDLPVNSALRPYYDAAGLRMSQIQASIPITEIIANTTTIDNDAYRAAYLVEPTVAQTRLVRVGQTAELPRTKIMTRDQSVFLKKYGRAIEVSYETIRRSPIDRVALLLARIAIQADVDKVSTAVDVLVNGDGNSNAATVVNLTTLDPLTTAGNVTLTAWLNFMLQFPNPYAFTTGLARSNVNLAIMTLNVGTANTMLAQMRNTLGIGGIRPINPEFSGDVALGTTTDAPANKLVGFDRRFAIEQLVEANAEINETTRWIQNQVEFLTISEVVGFDILDPNAVKIMDTNA
jgi:hypothetical protein